MSQNRASTLESLHAAMSEIELRHSEETQSEVSRDPEFLTAKKRALNILAARDHSRAELRDKLLKREHPKGIVDEVISRLTASGLLDDSSYARGYVRVSREQRQLSATALRRELSRKGIDQENIAQAVGEIDDEHELAFGVAMKKARSTVGLPRETRERRILGMLGRRGFPPNIALDVTRRALDEN